MNFPTQYQKEFYLNENFGNNGFDFDLRSQSHPEPHLRIAPLISSNNLDELRPGRAIAFEIQEDNQIKSFAGLESFLLYQSASKTLPNIYIFDNHNHAFYFWHLEKHLGNLPATPVTLIHIDQHKDSRIPATLLSKEDSQDLQKVFQYTNQILNVGNFIPPALHCGLLQQVIMVDSSSTLDNFFIDHPQFLPLQSAAPQPLLQPSTKITIPPFILDIDLDFFAPELDYLDNQKKLSLIQKLLPQANAVTMATSPFFIDQNLAINWCKKILQ